MIQNGIHIYCPTDGCSNRRLFDIGDMASGTIIIKCRECNQVVEINLHNATKGKKYLSSDNQRLKVMTPIHLGTAFDS